MLQYLTSFPIGNKTRIRAAEWQVVAAWARPDAKFGEAINEESALKYGGSDAELFFSIQGIPNSQSNETRAADATRHQGPSTILWKKNRKDPTHTRRVLEHLYFLYLHTDCQAYFFDSECDWKVCCSNGLCTSILLCAIDAHSAYDRAGMFRIMFEPREMCVCVDVGVIL